MQVLRWMTCLMALILQGVSNIRTAPNAKAAHSSGGDCEVSDPQGNIYNLSGLKGKNRHPRFTARHGDWWYSYTPCQPFSLGWPTYNGCLNDVAICMWTNTSFETIGKQSERKFEVDEDYALPMVVYTNIEKYPQWKAIVRLKCDPCGSKNEGNFHFTGTENNVWKFLLTSLCSCPNGCGRVDDSCPTAKGESSGEPKYCIPVIAALSFLVIAIPLFIYRRTIWRCIRRQNDPNNELQVLLPENNIRNRNAYNHINEGDDLPIQHHDSSENRDAAN